MKGARRVASLRQAARLEWSALETRISRTEDAAIVRIICCVIANEVKAYLTTFHSFQPGNTLWFKYQKKLPFDDSEWDDGFTTSDCDGHHISRFVQAWLCHFGQMILLAGFIYTDVVVLRELKRVKALRWNAVAYALVFMLYGAIANFLVNVVYFTNHLDADKKEFVSVV